MGKFLAFGLISTLFALKRHFHRQILRLPTGCTSVSTIEGLGTVATGVIAQGRVAPGDKVEVVGFGDTLESVVTGVEVHHKPLAEGVAGLSVGVRLRGVKADQISRGQVLAAPKSIRPH